MKNQRNNDLCVRGKGKRQIVYEKYDKHCAYCGKLLEYKQMQVDHLIPKARWSKKRSCFVFGNKQIFTEFKVNDIENLMPSCVKCNKFKGSMMLETFRKELKKQVGVLKRNSTQFNRALMFDQIQITEKPIVFYFERWEDLKK